ncbi:Flavanone 3-dioxygenase [Handroanthus impetiginosus]|uniref:Flavanone 3-dioxygenase n=1 Tax=Handroanthus impetiginosus TaxID=429701 RepID=A0A2G9I4W0_9LAMI|nr:Flavanone 3-dioxygenase [Handroanthus impetiginosus]
MTKVYLLRYFCLSDGPTNLTKINLYEVYIVELIEHILREAEAISKSLGLDKDCLKNILGKQSQHMVMNYYQACSEPELTYELSAHTNPNALTILLQDLQVAGLHVLKDGKWLAIKPHPDAFVINIGDQLQLSHYLVI